MAKLKKSIGKRSLLLMCINAILGTGIFFLPALGALYAGPASILSWIIMSFVAIFISLYFAELISMFPRSGGIYEYAREAFGDFYAFLVGWISWIVANITIAMLVVGSTIYLFPAESFMFKIILSSAFILFFNAVSYRGIEVSSKLIVFFGTMTVVSLLMIIVPGLASVNIGNFSPFFVAPLSSILLATYFIAETFFGWETVTYLAEEVKDARKVLPKMLVTSTVLIAAISMLVVFVSLGNENWAVFGAQPAPLSYLAGKILGSQFTGIFTLIIFIPLIGTAASWIVSSPRLLYAMSRNKTLPGFFGRIHDKHKTPHNAIIFQSIAAILITVIALGEFRLLLNLLVPLVVIMYCVVMLSVVKLRSIKPNVKRHFRAPFPRAGPLAIIIFNLSILGIWLYTAADAVPTFLLGLMLVLFGIPLYILIRIQTDINFTEKFFDRISGFWDRIFPLWYTRKDVNEVVKKLRLKQDSVVLDFGCGSGITTAEIARRAKRGSVVAVDISEKQLEHAVKRLDRMEISNVILIKEHELRFQKQSFDAFAAVGVLEYLDNPKRTMRKIVSYLKKGGSFSILSFGRSLGIPAPEHMKNENDIRKIFAGLPVEIHITKTKKKLTEYWHIWGRKKK